MSYTTLITTSVKDMLATLAAHTPTLLAVLAILGVGYFIARILKDALGRVLTDIHFDGITDRLGIKTALAAGGIKSRPSVLMATLVYWIAMIMTLVLAAKAFGLAVVDGMLVRLFAYVPNVIAAVFALMFGIIIAAFVSGIVRIVATGAKIPQADILASASKWAIVLFASTMFLEELGLGALLVGATFNYLFAGLCLALALSFGLGGKDTASHYLKKLHGHK